MILNSYNNMLVVVAALCLVGSAVGQDPLPPVYRLPGSVVPVSYMLRLEPHLDTNTVTGAIMIELKTTSNLSEPLTSITLHLGVDATLIENTVMLVDTMGMMKTIGAVKYDDTNTLVQMVLEDGDSLQNDHVYMLTCQFTSLLYSEPTGLFTGSFNGSSKYIASNFRPTFARNVFPCFDEPQFKTPLTLQLLRPSTFTAVFTAPLDFHSDPDANGMVLDTFVSTPDISLHSLGLFVAEVTPVTAMGIDLLALNGTSTEVYYLATLLTNITSLLGPFPLPTERLRLVVLPDRLFTAFSCYGFVFTSPEVYMGELPGLLKSMELLQQLTEAFLRQYLEFEHTPHWWSDIWLSESLGAFLATQLMPLSVQPWVTQWQKVVVRSDGLGYLSNCTGPVVNTQLLAREDIQSVIANQTIRNKGLSVLRMWDDTLPEGLVTKTILDYLQLNKSLMTTEDFLMELDKNIVANTTYNVTPTIDLLPFWLNSSSYPILYYWSQSSPNFTLSQTAGCADDSGVGPIWPVSISFAQNSTRDWDKYRQGLWLLDSTVNISTPPDKWTIFNLEAAPYRMDYGEDWENILSALSEDLGPSPASPQVVRAALQDDALALSLAGHLQFSTALAVLNSTQHQELDWYPVTKAFDTITALIGDDQMAFIEFGMFAETLFSPEFLQALDLRNSSNNDDLVYVRAVLTPWLCRFQLGDCRAAATELSEELLQGNTSRIAPDDLENVACYGLKYSANVLSRLLAAYTGADSAWLQHLYTIGLGCLTDQPSVQTVLGMLLNASSPISTTDARQIMVALASNVENSATVMDFVVSEAPAIQERLGVVSMSSTIKALGKFRVDLSQLMSLNNASLGLDNYVMQSAEQTIAAANFSSSWWDSLGGDLIAAFPQLPATTPASGNGSTFPTPFPTSASSTLADSRFFSLVIMAAVAFTTVFL